MFGSGVRIYVILPFVLDAKYSSRYSRSKVGKVLRDIRAAKPEKSLQAGDKCVSHHVWHLQSEKK